LRRSTFLNEKRLRAEGGGLRAKRNCFFLSSQLLALSLLFFLSGCGPKFTYPAQSVPKAIEDIGKKEYKLDIVARVVGKTVGALLYVDKLIDDKGQIPKEVHEAMGKVMQVVQRVSLSTDLPIDYCTTVIRDKNQPNELVITRALDDTKRANADMIGIEESINRTLFGQSKYEPPAAGKDSGFVLKDVRKEEFLAEQIVQRIRFSFAKDAKDEASQPFVLVDGAFEEKEGVKGFYVSIIAFKADDPRKMILDIFKVANVVLSGYHFTAFDIIEIQDYLNRQKLVIDQKTLLDYQQKKINDEALLAKCLTESQSIQEAFKLFGFNPPQGSADAGDAPIATAPAP